MKNKAGWEKMKYIKGARSRTLHRAIESAEIVTCMRAISACKRNTVMRNPDYLARHFLDWKWRFCFRFGWVTIHVLELMSPGAYFYLTARTKHIDSALTQVLEEGIEQIVILGAGNDTRPYRFCHQLVGIRTFELDIPCIQAQKKERLTKLFGDLPGNVTFIPIDFNAQAIEEALITGGYEKTRKTFFIWEGVSYYLSEHAVNSVLHFITCNSPSGSSVILDYALQSFILGNYNTHRSRRAARSSAMIGEPFVYGIEDGDLDQFLSKRGLTIISDFGPHDLKHEYLPDHNGTLSSHLPEFLRIVHAKVNDKGTELPPFEMY
jgi:methyltransferase (TIGR00027 family)